MYVILGLILCLTLAAPALAAPAQFTGAVFGVTDGDTITVLAPDMQQVKIRLYGIACQERGREFWSRAKQATADAVFGKRVTVQPMDTDRYGRIVAVVIMPGGKSLNEHLVREGLAWVDPQYCKQEDICALLRKLEKGAKGQQKGLWVDKTPIPQQDWMIRPGGGGPNIPGGAPR